MLEYFIINSTVSVSATITCRLLLFFLLRRTSRFHFCAFQQRAIDCGLSNKTYSNPFTKRIVTFAICFARQLRSIKWGREQDVEGSNTGTVSCLVITLKINGSENSEWRVKKERYASVLNRSKLKICSSFSKKSLWKQNESLMDR